MRVKTDTLRKIWNEEFECLIVAPYPDNHSEVGIMADGAKSEAYFGRIDLPMSPNFARHLAAALIACANEVEEKELK